MQESSELPSNPLSLDPNPDEPKASSESSHNSSDEPSKEGSSLQESSELEPSEFRSSNELSKLRADELEPAILINLISLASQKLAWKLLIIARLRRARLPLASLFPYGL